MAISQLEQAMATLRLGIAEMRAREEQLDAQINQFQTQLRPVSYTHLRAHETDS